MLSVTVQLIVSSSLPGRRQARRPQPRPRQARLARVPGESFLFRGPKMPVADSLPRAEGAVGTSLVLGPGHAQVASFPGPGWRGVGLTLPGVDCYLGGFG